MTTDLQATVNGWVVAITGSNRGIGRALAEAFASAGATVIAHARDEAAAREVAAALERSRSELARPWAAGPGRALAGGGDEGAGSGSLGPSSERSEARSDRGVLAATPIWGDLRDPELAARLSAAADSRGGLDALVLNAAVLGPMQALEDTDFAAFREAMEINVDAQLRLFVAALPALRARRGRVVWLTSYLGHAGLPGYGVYGASKHAVEGLMRLAHAEHAGDGIISVAVSPGMVVTEMLKAAQRGADVSMHTPPEVAAGRFLALVAALTAEHGGAVLDL